MLDQILQWINEHKDILGVVGTWTAAIFTIIACWPIYEKFLKNRKIKKQDPYEKSYLEALIKDLEMKNARNHWKDEFFVDIKSELQDYIDQSFYVVKKISPNINIQDFNSKTNREKIDSSKGTTYTSLQEALKRSISNASVVLGPPGSGKTVSLRNLSIRQAKNILAGKKAKIPIFINLGIYRNIDNKIPTFEEFLAHHINTNGNFSYLANGKLEELMKAGQCIFYLDGLDEMPRKAQEYEQKLLEIERFVSSWRSNQFVITCREDEYNRDLYFQQILLKPFEEKQIKLFCKKNKSSIPVNVFMQELRNNLDVLELSKIPFYLNLIHFYFKEKGSLPKQKVELFHLLIDFTLSREIQKQNLDMDKDLLMEQFMETLSNLAYHMSVKQQETVISLEEYKVKIEKMKRPINQNKMIELALTSHILEFKNREDIGFSHHRFQEFFASHLILKMFLKNPHYKFPPNFFTSNLWTETIFFMAGLSADPQYLVEKLIIERGKLFHKNKHIEKLLKLDISLLAYNSLNYQTRAQSKHFQELGDKEQEKNRSIYLKIRNFLIHFYKNATPLEKVKILNSIGNDKSPLVDSVLNQALFDKSNWVSEKAFLILTNGALRVSLNIMTILKELWRFFLEGKIFHIGLPLLKASKNSVKIALCLPFYFIFVCLTFCSIFLFGYIFYYYFDIIFNRMELAFTTHCIGCLFSFFFSSILIIIFFLYAPYPILKRVLCLTPFIVLLIITTNLSKQLKWPFGIIVLILALVIYGIIKLFYLKDDIDLSSISDYLLLYSIIMFTGIILNIVTDLSGKQEPQMINIKFLDDYSRIVEVWYTQNQLEDRVIDSIFEDILKIEGAIDDTKKRFIEKRFLDALKSNQTVIKKFGINYVDFVKNVIKLNNNDYKKLRRRGYVSALAFQSILEKNFRSELKKRTKINKYQPNTSYIISIAVISVFVLSVIIFVIHQLRTYLFIKRARVFIEKTLAQQQDIDHIMVGFVQMISVFQPLWSKKLLLKELLDKLTITLHYSYEKKIAFLNNLSINIDEQDLVDAIFQQLDIEESNLRRSI